MNDHEQPAAGVALKACPSCGPDGNVEVHGSIASARGRGVRCETCGFTGPWKPSSAKAIAAWNTRAPIDAGGAVSEARQAAPKADGDWRTCSRAEYDAMPDLSSPQPLQQGGEVTRAVLIEAMRDNVTIGAITECSIELEFDEAADAILALFASLAADRDKALGLLREVLATDLNGGEDDRLYMRAQAFLSSQTEES